MIRHDSAKLLSNDEVHSYRFFTWFSQRMNIKRTKQYYFIALSEALDQTKKPCYRRYSLRCFNPNWNFHGVSSLNISDAENFGNFSIRKK